MIYAVTTKPGKKYASLKRPDIYEALRKRGMSKQRAARISNAQASKDAGTMPGAQLSGPGGLLATPGMGTTKRRKWGKKKLKACTCNKAYEPGQLCPYCTADLALPDIGWYRCGNCGKAFYADDTDSDYEDYRAIRAERTADRGLPTQPMNIPTARVLQPPRVATKEGLGPGITRIRGNLCNVHGRYGPCDSSLSKRKPKAGGGRAAKPKKPVQTPEQRAQARAQEQAQNRTKVLGQLGIAPDGQSALEALRAGKDADPGAIERAGLVKAGLAEVSALGGYRLTPSGRAMLSAASAGDVGRAGDTISSARDRTSARTARQTAAQQRQQAAQAKRAAAQAAAKKRAAQAKRGGGGGAGRAVAGGAADRQAEHEQQRAQRQAEHEADRAQRLREHAEDRVRRLQEQEQDRAARQAASQTAPSQRASTATRVQPSAAPIVRRAQRQQKRIGALRRTATGGNAVTATKGAIAMWDGTEWVPVTKSMLRADDLTPLQASILAGDMAITKAVMSAASANDLPDSAFLYVEPGGKKDSEGKTVPRSLRHFPYKNANGGIDLPHLRNAIARIPQSNAKGLNKKAVQKRAQALLAKANERGGPGTAQKSFVVYKDDTDAYRWIARTTTAYRDRDGEIITTKALDQDALRMTATGQYGPLRYWHIGQPDPFSPLAPWGPGVDIGDCDYSIVIGRTSIESGTFKSHAVGKAFAENAQDYELSPGFFHPPNQPNAAGEYDNIRRFERSVVPTKYGRASNLFTGMTVKEERMDEATLKARVETFMRDMSTKGVPNQVVDNLLGGMQQADKSAQAWGIASKSDDDPWAAVVVALKAALMPAAPTAAMMAPPEEKDVIDDGDAPEDEAGEETEVVGDMTVADFEDMMGTICLNACTQAMQQFGSDIQGKMTALDDSLKTMGYARTKSEGEIAALKAEQERIANRLAELEGDKPVMVSAAEVEAVLKGAGPQAPKSPDAPAAPTPDRPFAGWAAETWPELYKQPSGTPPHRS